MERNRFYPRCLTSIGMLIDLDGYKRVGDLDLDELRSFFATFRRFFLDSDRCNLNKLYQAALALPLDAKTRSRIKLSQERVKFAKVHGYPMTVARRRKIDSAITRLKPENLFDGWI